MGGAHAQFRFVVLSRSIVVVPSNDQRVHERPKMPVDVQGVALLGP